MPDNCPNCGAAFLRESRAAWKTLTGKAGEVVFTEQTTCREIQQQIADACGESAERVVPVVAGRKLVDASAQAAASGLVDGANILVMFADPKTAPQAPPPPPPRPTAITNPDAASPNAPPAGPSSVPKKSRWKTLVGTEATLEFDETTMLIDLKRKFDQIIGVPPARQVPILAGAKLEGDFALVSDLGFKDNCMILVVILVASGKYCDGLDAPVDPSKAFKIFPDGFCPSESIEAFIQRLPTTEFAPHLIRKLLDHVEAFAEHLREAAAGTDVPSFSVADAVALFVYSYELTEDEERSIEEVSWRDVVSRTDALARFKAPIDTSLRTCTTGITQDLPADVAADPAIQQLVEHVRSASTIQLDISGSVTAQVYGGLNLAIRTHNDSLMTLFRGIAWHIQQALDKLPPVATTVYRGMPLKQPKALYKVGKKVLWPAFSSTSLDRAVCEDFCAAKETNPGELPTLFELHVHAARDIRAFSRFPEEAELLLPVMTVFEITQVRDIDVSGTAVVLISMHQQQ